MELFIFLTETTISRRNCFGNVIRSRKLFGNFEVPNYERGKILLE